MLLKGNIQIRQNKGIMMNYRDLDDKYYDIQGSKELYCLLTGLSYPKIGIKFYGHNTNKFIYRVRKLMKQLQVANRRQLAYLAVKEALVDIKTVKEYQNACNSY